MPLCEHVPSGGEEFVDLRLCNLWDVVKAKLIERRRTAIRHTCGVHSGDDEMLLLAVERFYLVLAGCVFKVQRDASIIALAF